MKERFSNMKLEVDKSFCISINNRVDRQNLALENLKQIASKTKDKYCLKKLT